MKKGLIKKFRENYAKNGKINKPGIGADGKPIKEQTNWVWFDRETIEAALAKADADGKTGGLKMFFGQYDEETISMIPADRPKREDYIGRISLVWYRQIKLKTVCRKSEMPKIPRIQRKKR